MSASSSRSRTSAAKLAAIVIAIIAIVCAGIGTIAFLSQEKPITNEFKMATVNIEVVEPKWDEQFNENTEPENKIKKDIFPGMTIDKNPGVKNNSNVDVWAFVSVWVPVVDGEEVFSYTPNEGWTCADEKGVEENGGVARIYYYDTALPAGETTSPMLFDTVAVNSNIDTALSGQYEVIVNGVGVQKNDFETVQDAYTAWSKLSATEQKEILE